MGYVIRAEHRFRPIPKIVNADKAQVCPNCHKRWFYPDLGCLKCRRGATPD